MTTWPCTTEYLHRREQIMRKIVRESRAGHEALSNRGEHLRICERLLRGKMMLCNSEVEGK